MVKSGLELVVWIIGGTEVVLNVDWGDGTACVVSCTNSSDMVVVTLNHTYTQTGNYTVAGMADNVLTTLTLENQTVGVYERIHDLVLSGNTTVLAPAAGVWLLAAGTYQLPLDNIADGRVVEW